MGKGGFGELCCLHQPQRLGIYVNVTIELTVLIL